MWVVSEIAAMATDLAEFLGGAIGLALLFDMPLLAGMAVTAIVTYAILMVEKSRLPADRTDHRRARRASSASATVVEMLIAPVDWGAAGAAHGHAAPSPDGDALMLAVGIIGATVMPHAVFLHSGLTQARTLARDDVERRKLVRILQHRGGRRARRRRPGQHGHGA